MQQPPVLRPTRKRNDYRKVNQRNSTITDRRPARPPARQAGPAGHPANLLVLRHLMQTQNRSQRLVKVPREQGGWVGFEVRTQRLGVLRVPATAARSSHI
jgi:hypothetical protein